MTTTTTDRYALALETIGLRVVRLDADALRCEDDNPETSAYLSRQAAEARSVLLDVVFAIVTAEHPERTAGERWLKSRRRCGDVLRDCEQTARGEA